MNRLAKSSVKPFRALGFVMKPGGEFSSRSRIAATTAALVLALALGYVDYVTGRDLAISAFYLLPISLAAWVAGRWWGFFVGALCTCLAFFSDTLSGPAYEHPLIPVWNAVMLLVFFVIVSWLLTDFRRSHYQLEQTVAYRTAALKAQIEERKQLLVITFAPGRLTNGGSRQLA